MALQMGPGEFLGKKFDWLEIGWWLSLSGWWFGTMEFYDFPYIGNNNPN
jgi:hypothetical protein